MTEPRNHERTSAVQRLLPTDRTTRIRLLSLGLSVLLIGLLLVQLVVANRRYGRMLGVFWDTEAKGAVFGRLAPGDPAEQAGLRPGDRVVAVNGVAVPDRQTFSALARSFESGQMITLEIDRDGQRMRSRLRPGIELDWGNRASNAMLVLAYLALALLALRQYDRDLRARLLFLFSCSVALEFVLPYDAAGQWLQLLVNPAFYLVTGLQMALELHLASSIPERQPWLRRLRWVVPLYYTVGLGLGLLGCVTTIAEEGLGVTLPWSLAVVDLLLFQVGFAVWGLAVLILLGNSALRYPEPQGRQQAALVFAGVLPWAAFTAIDFGHRLAGAAKPDWMGQIEPFVLLCYPLAVLVAISRFQLFDLELVVRRSLVYTALTTVLLLLFYAALGAGGVFFSEFFTGGDRMWVVAAATLLLGLVFTPLRRFLERLIYSRFFPERVALRQRLTTLAAELPAHGKLPLMGERLVISLGEILGIRWATLLIADPRSGLLMPLSTTIGDLRDGLERSLLLSPADPGLRLLTQSGRAFPARQLAAKSPILAQRLETLRAQVAVPLLSQGRLIGLLLLGPKHANDRYLAEEMDLLNLLAQHVAIVFENARLFESATRDSLTGLLRREGILERLDNELQRALRYDRPLAIGLADIDHFKSINDRFGHLTGDSMLKWVAHVLQGSLRATDHVGRYGGEEFLLVLPETDLVGAVTVAEKARCLVEKESFVTEDGRPVRITLSIGLSSLAELRGEHTARELIAAADRSLYEAKDEGRNQVRPTLAVGA